MPVRINTLKLVCFSPTGTTKMILLGIAEGINHGRAELIELTKSGTAELIELTRPAAREQILQTSANELLVVAVPVYMGRVPELLMEWLHAVEASRSPAVSVVVYGNRAYEDALIELEDTLINRGCISIAGAAFIGEHSFSSSETPIAESRPDERDLNHAMFFGKKIGEKLNSYSSLDQFPELDIPGKIPVEAAASIWNVDFIEVGSKCTQCGICAERCPVGAIDPESSTSIDKEVCITCCACIRSCPNQVRSMKPGPVRDAALWLGSLYQERKEPVYFI